MSSRYSPTEQVGVNAVQGLMLKAFGWIFREQPIVDMGIDAHIEIVTDKNPTGKLVGLQIKTGLGHFQNKQDCLIYYGSLTHLNYWLNHSLPVILVAHLPDTNETFWVHVNDETSERTEKAWKISIPKSQQLNTDSITALESLVTGTKAEVKRKNLFLHSGNVRFIKNGGKLVIYKEEWPNKALGRGIVKLIKVDQNGSEEVVESDNYWYTGYSTQEVIEKVYPWASLEVDKEFYEENAEEPYRDARDKNQGIYPYANDSGEVIMFRLELKLNQLGNSLIEVIDYIESET